MSEDMAKKYELDQPPFQGLDQVVEVPATNEQQKL